MPANKKSTENKNGHLYPQSGDCLKCYHRIMDAKSIAAFYSFLYCFP